MNLNLKDEDEIWSKDGHLMGLANHIYHRTNEVNPKLELYGRYLHVFSLELGDDYYVPMEFITEDKETGRFTVGLTMKEAVAKGWSRLPNFIVEGQSTKEELPKS
jgi:hypothetical protein